MQPNKVRGSGQRGSRAAGATPRGPPRRRARAPAASRRVASFILDQSPVPGTDSFAEKLGFRFVAQAGRRPSFSHRGPEARLKRDKWS